MLGRDTRAITSPPPLPASEPLLLTPNTAKISIWPYFHLSIAISQSKCGWDEAISGLKSSCSSAALPTSTPALMQHAWRSTSAGTAQSRTAFVPRALGSGHPHHPAANRHGAEPPLQLSLAAKNNEFNKPVALSSQVLLRNGLEFL